MENLTLNQVEEEIVSEFEMFNDWSEKYRIYNRNREKTAADRLKI